MLAGPVIEDLARALTELDARAGEIVIREGDPGERFYLIAEGELDVSIGGSFVRTMVAGDGFGEIALLRDVPRTATVTARTAARLYALERGPFLAALTGSAHARGAVEAIAAERLDGAR
jgi:CRP-like cAMP-binding protein